MSNGSANTYYTRDNNGKLVSERTSTVTYYYSLNSLGKMEVVSNPWQFASGFYDASTGLYKFGT